MKTQTDNITELLEQGIAEKRNGNYQAAVDSYLKAMALSPTDGRAYMNLFKVYCGLGQYDRALFYITIVSNLSILDQTYKQDPDWRNVIDLNYNWFNGNYTLYDDQQNKTLKIGQQLVQQMVKKNESLNELIYRAANLTFYIGHAYLGYCDGYYKILGIPADHFSNLNLQLLGKKAGATYRDDSEFECRIMCMGFVIAHLNLLPNAKTKADVINYKIKNQSIKNNIFEYKDF